MAQRYKDKVTIITGGSKGIGEGCVRVFGELKFYLLALHYTVCMHASMKLVASDR
jgi:NAD(P)-dependent dehydrogenase (short-subunit alcohol dehydrogenase family)